MLTLPLLLLACHDVERAGVQYAEAPEPTVPEVLSLIDRANRVSMMLRGVRPTPEESARIAGEPAALAELVEPPVALGAGHAMPAAWADAEPLDAGAVDEPPQAVARRATPTLSTVSLAMRGATWGSEVIEKSPRSKGANGL